MYLWGKGDQGQLANGKFLDGAIPARIKALEGKQVKAIALGAGHVLAMVGGGKVFAWGENASGQLGIGKAAKSPKIVKLLGGASKQCVPKPVIVKVGEEVKKVIVALAASPV
jgi:alpha-tubulin suppressor-like RCC1 family protein